MPAAAQLTFPPLEASVIIGHPTPNIGDVVVMVRRDKQKPSYRELELGSPHPNTNKYPSHKLVAIMDDQDGQKASWFYVKPRAEQDFYNWQISYPYADVTYPRVTRTYYFLRSAYAPEAAGDPDPDPERFPSLIHTDEALSDITEADAQFYKNLFVKVVRTYDKIPGPLLTGATQTAQGIFGTLTLRRVGVSADADTGANVLESTVTPENTVTGMKSTRTGALWSGSGTTVSPTTLGAAALVNVATSATSSTSSGLDILSSDSIPDGPLRFSNKTVSLSWPVLVGNELATLSRYGHLIRFVSMVNRTETTDRVAPGTITPGSFNVLESETKAETVDRSIRRVVTIPGFETLVDKSFDEFGTLETVTSEVVVPSTSISQNGSTTQELTGVDTYRSLLVTRSLTVDGSGHLVSAIVTEIEKVDEHVPGSRATVYYYLVDAASTIPADTATTVYVRKRYAKNSLMKIEVKTVYAIPASYVEYRDLSFPFPTLFTFYNQDDITGTTRISRGAFSANVPHKIIHSFAIAPDITVPIPYLIIENDLLIFSVPLHGVMDAGTANTSIGGVTHSQAYPASIPSLTLYLEIVALNATGDLTTVGGSSEVWRASIYETITIQVAFH